MFSEELLKILSLWFHISSSTKTFEIDNFVDEEIDIFMSMSMSIVENFNV